jgi:serine phosphatase RsbU (regulator of sigma subunit)
MSGRPQLSGTPGATPAPAKQRPFLGTLPFLLMAVIGAIDLSTGPTQGFLPVLSIAPATASISRRPRQTALTGVLALALCVLLALHDRVLGGDRGIIALVTIFGVTVVGVVASTIRQRQEREYANVLAVAEVAQQVLLRPVPGQTPPLRVSVRYVSASAASRIGGDLYEVIATPAGVRFILGDVQGKGLPAVRTAAVVLGAFREAAFDAKCLAEIAARIELSLKHQAAVEEFVTVVLGQAAVGEETVEILSCGHPPPLLIRGDTVTLVEGLDPGLALGLAALARPPLEPGAHLPLRVDLASGDQLLFYTDGVSEARDATGVFYPLDRGGELLADADQEAALDRLQADVVRYVGHALNDDAAMLLVRLAGQPPAQPGESSRSGDLAQ